jgi:hypothetical protein
MSQNSHTTATTEPKDVAPAQKWPCVTIETVSDEDEMPGEELSESFHYLVDVNQWL